MKPKSDTAKKLREEGSTGDPLLARIRRGEEEALEEMGVKYGSDLTKAAWLFLGREDLAEEVVVDTIASAWFGARRTGPDTQLRSWLFGILFNTMRKTARTRSRRARHEGRAAKDRPAAAPQAAASLEAREEMELLSRALQELEEALRSVVILRYERKLSVGETAEALGIPEGTVKSRTHTALQRLRIRLKGGVE